jgi:hypothetical protein
MTVRTKLIIVGVVILLEAIAVGVFARRTKLVHEGTSAGFWRNACGVKLDAADTEIWGGIYAPRDGWYIYYDQSLHGQRIYRVRRSVAVADYSRVLDLIEQADHSEPLRLINQAYAVIHGQRATLEHDPDRFLRVSRDKALNDLKLRNERSYQYTLKEELLFEVRWKRFGRFWMNIVFEIAHLAGLTLCAAWPWLRSQGKWRWSIHLAAVPLLLFLPFYLGYCQWTFTSVGPSGGALYPWVIVWLRGLAPSTPLDHWIVERTPQILEPLSQQTGPWISMSGREPFGPVAATACGVLIFGMVLIALTIRERVRRSMN